MIWESSVWKADLQKELEDFDSFLVDSKTSEDAYFNFRVERFFFISAFEIRKLNEANMLSDELVSKDFDCIKYGRKDDSSIDYINYHHIERFYNFEEKEKVRLKLKDICNYFIHSFHFFVSKDDSDKLCGVFVNSDWTKDEFLYYIGLNTFIELIMEVINDNIVSTYYDRRTGTLKKSCRTIWL